MDFFKKHAELITFLILFLSLLILIFLTAKDYGITWDEKVYLYTGRHYVTKILNTLHIPHNLAPFDFYRVQPQPMEHIIGHGVFFDTIIFFFMPLFNRFSYENFHLLKALLAVTTFIFIYLTIRKLINWQIATASFLLLWLFPHFYGDIFSNSIDIPTAIILSAVICSFTYYFFSKPTVIKSALLTFALGVGIGQRIILLYVLVLVLTTVFLREILLNKNIKAAVIRAAGLGFFSLLFAHLTHPYLFTHPITGLIDMLNMSKLYPFSAANLFDGQFYLGSQLPWYFLPKMILITVPEATIALFLIGNGYLIYQIFKKRVIPTKKLFYIFLLSLMYLPILALIIIKPTIYDSWRHFLFLTVPLIIIAAYGFLVITRLKLIGLKIILLLIITINLFQTGWTMIRLHPYQYVYYNSLVGGLKGAYRQYETDYWGAGFKEAVLWFNKNINQPDKQYAIIAEGDALSTQTYFKNNMHLTSDRDRADYVFTFTRWNLDQTYPGQIVYTVQRDNTPLIIIKKL